MTAPKIRVNGNRIRLSDEKFRALSMRCLDQLSYTEIGVKMGISQVSAFKRVQSALEIVWQARQNEMRLCKE